MTTPKQRLIEAVLINEHENTNHPPENPQWEHGYMSATKDFLKLIEEIIPNE